MFKNIPFLLIMQSF